MAWSDGGAWSTKTFPWNSLDLEVWDGSHGPWSDDVEAWNGFAAAASFALSVGMAAPTWEVHQFSSMELGVSVGQAVDEEAHGDVQVSLGVEGNLATEQEVHADSTVSFALENGLLVPVEAHAAPQDLDDAWSVADGNWDDAGGGVWNQPGGVPLRLDMDLFPSGGIDIVETVVIGAEMGILSAPIATSVESVSLEAELEVTSAGEAHADGTFQLDAAFDVASANNADLVESVSLELHPGISLFGGFLFDAGIELTVSVGVEAERERLSFWTEGAEVDAVWLEELAASSVWLGVPFQNDTWVELTAVQALWLEEVFSDASWENTATIDSVWSTTGSVAGSWNKGSSKSASWTKQFGVDKEWS